MENLGIALQISGIGIVVLLLVLTALAGLVYLMTLVMKDKEEAAEEVSQVEAAPVVVAKAEESKKDLKLAAAVAVAIARAQAEMQTVPAESAAGEVNAWRQFGLQRRLNQSSTIRRTK